MGFARAAEQARLGLAEHLDFDALRQQGAGRPVLGLRGDGDDLVGFKASRRPVAAGDEQK
jgi:hypothetical protein